jgi:hypothetical protein
MPQNSNAVMLPLGASWMSDIIALKSSKYGFDSIFDSSLNVFPSLQVAPEFPMFWNCGKRMPFLISNL